MRVGLTGGVASGKSTVARMLTDRGALVLDADVIARQVVAPGTLGLARVVAEFGEELLTPDGELDREAMASLVFGDVAARRRLEAIVHPLVSEQFAREEGAAQRGQVVVHDIPLLVESGKAKTFDAVIVVDVPPQIQIERMVGDRGWTRAAAESRIAAQSSREDRMGVATYLIENTGTFEDLGRAVDEIYRELTIGRDPFRPAKARLRALARRRADNREVPH